jgi:anti-sigma B factor antagonist
MLTIQTRLWEGSATIEVYVVSLAGRLILGEESKALREVINQLLAEDKKCIVVNLAELTYIDSSGIGELVRSFQAVKSRGGSLKLANLGSQFQELLQLTRLLTVFDVYPDIKAAVVSFA